MVASIIIGAAGIAGFGYNWASSIYTYNRDAWMTDIQVVQNHNYQSENLHIQMSSMDREEVRDVMQADINKINNTILVTTLILALAGEMLFEGQVPASCPAFVLNAYMICLGSAAFHLVLSILFGVFASHEAYAIATELLTKKLRPDWESRFKQMQKWKAGEATDAFEEKPTEEIFRLPLASRFAKMMRGGDPSSTSSRLRQRWQEATRTTSNGHQAEFASGRSHEDDSSQVEVESDGQDASGRGRRRNRGPARFQRPRSRSRSNSSEAVVGKGMAKDGERSMAAQESQVAHRWRKFWEDSEAKRKPLTTCMLKSGTFGTKNLLEACGYWCLGTLYGEYSAAWAYWAVQIIFVMLNVMMMKFLMARVVEDVMPGNFIIGDAVSVVQSDNHATHWSSEHESPAATPMLGPLASGVVKGLGLRRGSISVDFGGEVFDVPEDDLIGSSHNLSMYSPSSLREKAMSWNIDISRKLQSLRKMVVKRVRKLWDYCPVIVALYPALGPVFCAIAAATDDPAWDVRLVPACYFIHMTFNAVLVLLPMDGDFESKRKQANMGTNLEEVQEESPQHVQGNGVRHRNGVSNGFGHEAEDKEGYFTISREDSKDSSKSYVAEGESANCLQRCLGSQQPCKSCEDETSQVGKRSQQLPLFLLRCGMFVLVMLWGFAWAWAIFRGATLDFKNKEAFISVPWSWLYGSEVVAQELRLNTPASPYFIATSVVCPRDKVFLANKFTIYENITASDGVHPGRQTQVKCDINKTIQDIDAFCVGDNCTLLLLLDAVPPVVAMCRNDGCPVREWPLLQTKNAAEKFTTLLADNDNASVEQVFATTISEDVRSNQSIVKVANASGFVKGDVIEIIQKRGHHCRKEIKTVYKINSKKGGHSLVFETGLSQDFEGGASVKKEDVPPEQLIAAVGRNVIEYRFDANRRGYMPLWDVVPEMDQGAGDSLTALDFSLPGGQARLVMFYAGGKVVSQDKATGQRCGQWSLPQGRRVVGGGCAYEGGSTVIALVKKPNGTMTLQNATLKETSETSRCSSDPSVHCTGGGFLGSCSR